MEKGIKIALGLVGLVIASGAIYYFGFARPKQKAKVKNKQDHQDLASQVAIQIATIGSRPSRRFRVNTPALAIQLEKIPVTVLRAWHEDNLRWLDSSGNPLDGDELEQRFKGIKERDVFSPQVAALVEGRDRWFKRNVTPLIGEAYGG